MSDLALTPEHIDTLNDEVKTELLNEYYENQEEWN